MSDTRRTGPYDVLIIDDETDVRQLLEHLLDEDAFSVETAGGGAEGLEYIRESSTDVDIVLLDIAMPEMDGFEVLQRIQDLQDPPLSVVLSSRDDEEAKVRAFELGAVDYVTKPFSTAVLVARLVRHLERADETLDSFSEPWVSATELLE